MRFAFSLNMLCEMLPCSAGEIAQACGISPSTLSRYRSGQRMPTRNGKTSAGLARGLSFLLRKYGVNRTANEDDIILLLFSNRAQSAVSSERLSRRLDSLMHALKLHNADIAASTGVDPSYVSRIRRGERSPHEKTYFVRMCATLAAKKCLQDDMVDILPSLEGIGVGAVSGALSAEDPQTALVELLAEWLLGVEHVEVNANVRNIAKALDVVDRFDFYQTRTQLLDDEYWTKPHGETDMCADSQFFYGLEGGREAELIFIREILDAEKPGKLTIFSNMDTGELTSDEEFVRHHRSGLMRFLERGGRIDIVHDLHRPFSEIISGLEYCLPLYLTGRVKTYRFSYEPDSALRMAVYIADSCAFSAESIGGDSESRRCHLVKSPSEVAHYRRKATMMLEMAQPLFDLYRLDDFAQLQEYEKGRAQRKARNSGTDIMLNRYDGLRIASYPDECSVVAFVREPKARAVIYDPNINQVISHLGELLG